MKHLADNHKKSGNKVPQHTAGKHFASSDEVATYSRAASQEAENVVAGKHFRTEPVPKTEPSAVDAPVAKQKPKQAKKAVAEPKQKPAQKPAAKKNKKKDKAKSEKAKQSPPNNKKKNTKTAAATTKKSAAKRKEKSAKPVSKSTKKADAPTSKKKRTFAEWFDENYRYHDNTAAKTEVQEKRPHTECPATPTAPVPSSKAGYAPAFLFGGFILVTALCFIIAPKATYSASEKRVLTEFPKASAETIFNGSFGSQFEKYFADHFPARNLWVGVNAYTNLVEGNNGAGGVYNAREGFLVNKPVPVENQLENNLSLLADFKADIGDVPMSAMIVPSTGYIIDDRLPLIHAPYRDDEYFGTIGAKLGEANISFVDLRNVFLKEYQTGTELYYRTDHHWTTRAAYTAYREFSKLHGLITIPEEGFEIESFPDFYGTTYSKSGFWLNGPDVLEVWKNTTRDKDDIIHVAVSDGGVVKKEQDSLFFYEHAKEDDKYPIFLDGNHAKTVITNPEAQHGTIVVIKDSFCHCFAPFLADSYKKVILIDPRYSTEDVTRLVKEEKPEQVLALYGFDNFATDTDIGHLWG